MYAHVLVIIYIWVWVAVHVSHVAHAARPEWTYMNGRAGI